MTRRSFRMTLLGAVFAAPVAGHCQTPPTYIGIAHGSSSSAFGPVTINVPPGTQNGDLMLAYIATQSPDGAWITAPCWLDPGDQDLQHNPRLPALLAHRQ